MIIEEIKTFLKDNFHNGYKPDEILRLYLFHNEKKGYYTKKLKSCEKMFYWVFTDKKFDSWEDMYFDVLHKY